MILAGPLERVGNITIYQNFVDKGINWKIILKWILQKSDMSLWTGISVSG